MTSITVTVEGHDVIVDVPEHVVAVDVPTHVINVAVSGPPGPPGTGGGGPGGGVTDHGELTGLADADHPIAAVQGLQGALDGKAAATHTHSQSESHNAPDTDLGASSLHHTLGTGATQAAHGNHTHTPAAVGADPAGTAAASMTAHTAAADPHTTYLNQTRGDARYSQTGHNHAGVYDPAGTAASAVSAHAAAADPHPVYLTQTEGDGRYSQTAHNHAGVYDPAGTAASAVSAHAAAADPHTGYALADGSRGPSWPAVAALANLPGSGNWLGRKIKVTGGLGLQVMVWNGSAWVVSPESATAWMPVTVLNAGSFGGPQMWVRRAGDTVNLRWIENTTAGTGTGVINVWQITTGWLIEAPHNYAGAYTQALDTATGAVLTQAIVALPVDQIVKWYGLTANKGRAAALTWITPTNVWPTSAPS